MRTIIATILLLTACQDKVQVPEPPVEIPVENLPADAETNSDAGEYIPTCEESADWPIPPDATEVPRCRM